MHVNDRDGADPLYDLGPLPGGEVLFRAASTGDALSGAGAPPPLTHVGSEPDEAPPSTVAPAQTVASAPPRMPAPRRIPPPQTYHPTPPLRPGPASSPPPVDLRRGRALPPGPGAPRRGAGPVKLLRWALRHPRLTVGVAFAVITLVANAGGGTSGSDGLDGSSAWPVPGVGAEPPGIDVGVGDGEMTYLPEQVPGSVTQWLILVDNDTDGDADYRIEDETTGELLGAGTNPAGSSATFAVPADRLGDRVSIVQDVSAGSGPSSCHVLADDAEVGTAESEAAIRCVYDPDSLRR